MAASARSGIEPARTLPHLLLTDPGGICAHANSHVIEYKGGPVADIKRPWAEICEAAGFDDVTRHTLKHTAITWAIANGMSREDAASYYSTSIATIEATYWHHSPHYQKAAADITDKKAR